MLRIAIVEDNSLQQQLTEELLRTYLDEDGIPGSISSFLNGASLNDALSRGNHFDLYLLDMLLPDTTGIEIASTLRMMGDDASIVFLTSTPEYAVQSYDVKAAYYLLKPLDRDKFHRIIREVLTGLVNKTKDEKGFPVSTAKGEMLLLPEDIVYVTVRDRRPIYVLQTKSGLKQEVCGLALRGSFHSAMSQLLSDTRFVECGPSCVLCLGRIESVEDDCVAMRNGDIIYVSRSAASALMHRWQATRRK